MGTVDDDFWYMLPDRPYRVGRAGSVWRFFRGRGGKNLRWKPLKIDKVGRVTLCVYNEPAEVSVAQLVLEAFGPPSSRPVTSRGTTLTPTFGITRSRTSGGSPTAPT